MIPGNLIVQYPFDAQSDSFFCALSSMLVPALGYDENTPFYCAPHSRYCVECGGCRKNAMQRHHLMLYHCMLTASGVAFCFDYPEDDSVDAACHTYPGVKFPGWRWDDEFIGFIMGLCSLGYRRFAPEDGKAEILAAIKASVDAGYPVAARLGGKYQFGSDTAWSVITGYEDDALIGIDSKDHYLTRFADYEKYSGFFALEDWYPHFIDAVVITGKEERKYGIKDVLTKISGVLSSETRAAVKNEIYRLIESADDISADKNAEILCAITGFPAEARWHAAEAFCSRDNFLSALSEDDGLKAELRKIFFERYIRDNSGETHGLCWKIWSLLGGAAKSDDAGQRLLKAENKAELKALWEKIFENDDAVLDCVNELIGKI